MKQRLLEYLVCPVCGADLQVSVTRQDGDEIEAGSLECTQCSTRWPIVGGIPRMVPQFMESEKRQTARAFGYEWTQFSELTPEYEQQFLDWIAPVTANAFREQVVLDGGCGKGRHIACAAKFGAREVVGVDLSEAVDSAYRNTRHLQNVHILQADLYHLPLRPGSFDYVYSIGVLHHLPDPRLGFNALVPMVRARGRISAWVYGRENNGWIVHIVTPVRSLITSRMPPGLLNFFSGMVAALLLLPALRLIYRPANRWLKPLARYLFYNEYLSYISRFSFRELHSIVLDHLIAPAAHYVAREEFVKWFARQELAQVQIAWHNRNSWRGTAIRTAGPAGK